MKFMKFAKPLLSMTLGTLLILGYLNLLQGGGEALAIGIIALILGLSYVGYGVVAFLFADRLPAKAKDGIEVAGVAIYPLFLFVYMLLIVIQLEGNLGPTGWIVAIIAMTSGLGFLAVFASSRFVDSKPLRQLSYLCAAIFGLALVLLLIFNINGNARGIGDLTLLELLEYASYGGLLALAFMKKDEPREEAPAEEEPKEEAPAEEPKEEPKEEPQEAE